MYKSVLYYKHSILLHVSAILVAILRELHYKRWIYRDITNVCAMHKCKILSFNNEWFKIHIKI